MGRRAAERSSETGILGGTTRPAQGPAASEQSEGHQGSRQRCFHHLLLPDHQDLCCLLEAPVVGEQVLAPCSPPSGDPPGTDGFPCVKEPMKPLKYTNIPAELLSDDSFAHGSFGLGT